MNLLLTGCAGFIGSNVARLLLERGDTVVGIDDLNDAYDTRLKTWRLDRLKSQPNFTFLRADVADSRRLTETVQPVAYDAVINLAARAGVRQSVE
ncbi:MAG: NAD-dependent epimerase/dehydratase family protein, partial [SAR202 cluster bacterium]|nr:NAD-dependent epimerase/dehydratase family protein [SAR202 cluster bacterium]